MASGGILLINAQQQIFGRGPHFEFFELTYKEVNRQERARQVWRNLGDHEYFNDVHLFLKI